jgi:uncharacterized membrane-anchored protein
MEDLYPEDIYEDEYYYEPEPRRGMGGWVIAFLVLLVLAVVCFICLCVATLLLGPAVGTTFSTIVETIEATTPMP